MRLAFLRNTAVNSTTASSVQVCQFASSISPLQKKAEKNIQGLIGLKPGVKGSQSLRSARYQFLDEGH